MDKIFERKREREGEEVDEVTPFSVLQKEINEYNASVLVRLKKHSVTTPCPLGKGLTTDCLLWKGCTHKSGYGTILYKGKNIRVHQAALMIFMTTNKLPKTNLDGDVLEVAHICDIANCCEPSHVYHATKEQNSEDRVKNGRNRGDNHCNSKITEDQAREIKLSKGEGSQKVRASQFNVSLHILQSIDKGATWAHLPDKNGNTSDEKRRKKNEKTKYHKRALKEKPWTKDFCDIAHEKLKDQTRVMIDPLTNCMLWKGSLINGYPQLHIGGIAILGHVMACTIGNNYIRKKDLQASHECGQTRCVNPDHLKFKTPSENMEDKIRHGTHAHKLSYDHVIEIRKRHADGETQRHLAKVYNVGESQLSRIVRNQSRTKG